MPPPTTVFEPLTALNSKDVLVINNYHGRYSIDQMRSHPTVIYTCFGEVFNHHEFEVLMACAPQTRFIIITGRKYLLQHSGLDRCHVFYLPSAYGQYAEYLPIKDFDLDKKIFKKKFLSLNFRAQWNRQALAQFLVKTGLCDDFYFSYHAEDRFGKDQRTLYDEVNVHIGHTWFNQDLDLDQFYDRLPFVTGLNDPLQSCNDWSWGALEYYTNTFCSFVNETYIDENHDPFFTEKIFKPIAYGHPFLVFSSAGALELMHELGIETFSDVFDESYDTIANPQQRFEQLLLEVQRICKLPARELDHLHKHLIGKLSKNQKTFRQILPDIFEKQLDSVIHQIENILAINL